MQPLYAKFESAYLSWVARRFFEGEIDGIEVERLLKKIDSLRVEFLLGEAGPDKGGSTNAKPATTSRREKTPPPVRPGFE